MGSNTNINQVTTTDASRQLGMGSMLADGGSTISTSYTTNTTTTDQGALRLAAHMVDAGVGAAAQTGLGALGLADSVTGRVAGVAGSALDAVSGMFGGALDAVTAGNRQAWSSASGMVDGVVGNAVDAVAGANARALSGMAATTADAIGAVQGSASRAYGLVDSVIAGQGALFGAALDAVMKAETQSQDAFSAASSQLNTAYADAKGRGAMTDKLLMVMLVGSLVVAAIAISKRS